MSTCTDNCGTAENPWDDAMYGVENGIFLKNFFDAYPEFRDNDLYLTGESYAGIYIPSNNRKIHVLFFMERNLQKPEPGDGF